MMRALAVLLCLMAGLSPVMAQRYRCQTDPIGAATANNNYCASEAFVMQGAHQVLTFATLPACSSANKSQSVFITDSNTGTFNASITAGGGANAGLAVCNGTNWTFH